jgi:PmbA protein
MQSSLDIVSRLLEQTRALGASGGDAVLFETIDLNVSQRMGKPEGLERSENKAVGLRAFVGAQQACVSSTDLSKDALQELAARAVAMAKAAPADADSTLAPASLHPATIPALDLFDENEPDASWLRQQCKIAEDAALSVEGVTNSEGADAGYSQSRISLAIHDGTRIGFARFYQNSHFSLSVSVLAGADTAMERDYDYSSAHHRSDLTPAHRIGISAGERAVGRLNARKVATCNAPIVFDPRVSKQLLGIFAGSISGSAITRGSSFLKDDMGKAIFAPHVTLIDDPHIRRGLGSKPFDGEGVANKKLALVEGGVLKSWLLDMRSANRLKLPPTGHASRGVGAPPSPSTSNLYMQPGIVSPTELMADIKSGFYVTETFGMGVNTTTGDYSQGASGFWIEGGEIAYPVSEITIAGRLRDMFAGLTPANDLEFRYATNAPTVRVDAMTIAGL